MDAEIPASPAPGFLDDYLGLIGADALDRISALEPYTKEEIENLVAGRYAVLSAELHPSDQAWEDLALQRDHIASTLHSRRNVAAATRILPWIQEQLPRDDALEIYLVRDALYFLVATYLLSTAGVSVGTQKWGMFFYSKVPFKTEPDGFYHGREKAVSAAWNGNPVKTSSLYGTLEKIISDSAEEAKIDERNADLERMYALMRSKFREQVGASEKMNTLSRNVYQEFRKGGFLGDRKVRLVDVCITGTTLLSLKLIIEHFAAEEGTDISLDIYPIGRYLTPRNLGGFDPESLLARRETITALQKVYNLDIRDLIVDMSNNRAFLAELIVPKKNMRWGNPVRWSEEQASFVTTPPAERLVVYVRLLYLVNGVIDYLKWGGTLKSQENA